MVPTSRHRARAGGWLGAALAAQIAFAALAADAPAADGIANTFTPAGVAAELVKAREQIERGQFVSAIAALNNIVAAEPRNADAHNLLGFGYRKMRAFARAETSYQRALRLDPDHRGALEYLGELYLETGRRHEAERLLARLDRLCPDGCEELDDLRAALADTSR